MNELDRNIETSLANLKEVRLSSVARDRIARELQVHTSPTPVTLSPFNRIIASLNFNNQNILFMPAFVIALMLLVGGGTSAAAAKSLPGDFLYPIKTEVNERLETALTFNDADKASLHAELAHERLFEAETLAAEGKLSTSTAEKIAENLKQHRERAESLSDDLEKSGDLETSAQVHAMITGTFRTYEDVLDSLDKKVSGNNSHALLSDIRHYLENRHANASSTPIVLSDTTKKSVADTVAYADTVVNDANNALLSAGNLPAQLIEKIKKTIADAVDREAEAKVALTNNQYQEAYNKATHAIQKATEAKTLISSTGNIEKHHKGDKQELESIINDSSLDDLISASTTPTNLQSDDTNLEIRHSGEREHETEQEREHEDEREIDD
jgi:hypothetical protein